MDLNGGTDFSRIKANLAALRARISSACGRVGRDPQDVTLVAVTKGRPAQDVEALAALGAVDVGENRLREAESKAASVTGARWHMIGHLQRNKVRKAVPLFSMLHSADSVELLELLDRAVGDPLLRARERPLPILVQVNVSGEGTKSGIEPFELEHFLEAVFGFCNVAVRGLMTMAPWSDDPESARPHFRKLAELGRAAAGRGLLPSRFDLSMGMTGDFEVAVEEGATIVRIGTALFA